MASQEGEEGTCDRHPGQESLQTLNEWPSSGCAASSDALAAFAHLAAFGLCRECGAPGKTHDREERERVKQAKKD